MDQSPRSNHRSSRLSRRQMRWWLVAIALFVALDRLLRLVSVSEEIRIAVFGLALIGLIGWTLISLNRD
jgi:hypothetical protein